MTALKIVVPSVFIWLAIASITAADPWTLPNGEVSASVSLLGTRSRSFFNDSTSRVHFLNNGLSRVVGAAVDGAYGLTDALTVTASVPVLRYRIRDDFIHEEGLSLGDIRVSSRYRILDKAVIAALEVGVRFPTAAAVDPARVQVGEGQYDYDMVGSLGWSNQAGYGFLDLGYRIRRRSARTEFRPGDEVLFRTGGGLSVFGNTLRGSSLGWIFGSDWKLRLLRSEPPSLELHAKAGAVCPLGYLFPHG